MPIRYQENADTAGCSQDNVPRDGSAWDDPDKERKNADKDQDQDNADKDRDYADKDQGPG